MGDADMEQLEELITGHRTSRSVNGRKPLIDWLTDNFEWLFDAISTS